GPGRPGGARLALPGRAVERGHRRDPGDHGRGGEDAPPARAGTPSRPARRRVRGGRAMKGATNDSVARGAEDPVLIDLIDLIARKVQAGEPVDLEAYTQAHPEHAERLCRLLPAIQMLADLKHSSAPAGASAPAADRPPGLAGGPPRGFRLLGGGGGGGGGGGDRGGEMAPSRRAGPRGVSAG